MTQDLPSLHQLKQNIHSFTDWEGKFKYIIDIGKKLPPFPDTHKTTESKVTGCTSNVWLINTTLPNAQTFTFQAVSDASIVNGLIAILMTALNNQPPIEILKTDIMALFKELELDQHLSPNRANGFFSMVKKIQQLAVIQLKSI